MRYLVYILSCCLLLACHSDNNTLTVGTIDGPETELVESAKTVLEKAHHIKLKIVPFYDYNIPNQALAEGDLDINVFQHLPYLQASIEAHGYPLEVVGKTFIYPTGIYSQKIHTLDALPENARIAIPNDPSNEARALILLESSGLITLSSHKQITPKDISENPHHLDIIEIDAAQLPRILPDVDAAVINTTFAIPAGLIPTKDAIFLEGKDSPYANLIVAKQDSPKQVEIQYFVEAMHSPEVLERAKILFGPSAIPAW
ncbi:MAG: MetQ/NlpA family ABC transporter substrate-binding protein [Legionellaceae bacterium]|nr:MetQ/NlpA family ABC transporter substrate-binding protein [Legionellaceae bacterium]